MTALSVLPGALFDKWGFGERLKIIHWTGIGLFLFGAWAIQDFPNLSALITLPAWMWLAYTFPLAAATNEALARYAGIKYLKPTVITFWIGVTQLIICGGLLLLIPGTSLTLINIPNEAWVSMVVLGVLIWLSHMAKQMAYVPTAGGTIVAKKIIMISVLLLGLFVYDWLWLGLLPSSGKWIGFSAFILAMYLVYKK